MGPAQNSGKNRFAVQSGGGMTSRPYKKTGPGRMLVDYGPVHMTISAWAGNSPASVAVEAGAERAVSLLQELSDHLSLAREPIGALRRHRDRYPINALDRMAEAVNRLGEDDFTPMAAVAGTFSDLVKETALDHGADRVIVNNGGDISFRVGPQKTPVKVGIVDDLMEGRVSHVVHIGPTKPLAGVEGIATSGFGGRSLTKGVASAVTCFAVSGALADAAATAVANATRCDHPAVEHCAAEALDALTDLKGQPVTARVGELSPDAIATALDNGLNRAKALYAEQVIAGVMIFVQKRFRVWPAALAQSTFF